MLLKFMLIIITLSFDNKETSLASIQGNKNRETFIQKILNHFELVRNGYADFFLVNCAVAVEHK